MKETYVMLFDVKVPRFQDPGIITDIKDRSPVGEYKKQGAYGSPEKKDHIPVFCDPNFLHASRAFPR